MALLISLCGATSCVVLPVYPRGDSRRGSIPARAGNHRPFSRQSVSTGSIPQTRGDNAFWNAQRAQAGMTMGNNPNQAARIGEIGVLWTALRLEQMIGQVDAVENDVQSHGNMPGLHAPPQ